jgi:hypothetical protein
MQPVRAAPHARRLCVLHHYADAIRSPDLAKVVTLALRFQHGPTPSPSDAPILPPDLGAPGWGPGSLLLPIAHDAEAAPPPPAAHATSPR